MSDRSPTMAAVLSTALRRHTDALRVALPGQVESFDAATQTADILPLVRQTDTADGRDVVTPFPVLPSVPVLFPGGGFYSSTMPVQRGDLCLVVFCDYSLDEWWTRGGQVTPVDTRLHGLDGAVAIIGLRSKPDALPEFDSSRAVFGCHGPRVACDGAAVHLGVGHNESATQASVRGTAHVNAIGDYLDALKTQLEVLATAVDGVVPGTSVPIKAALLAAKSVYTAVQHTTPKVKVP